MSLIIPLKYFHVSEVFSNKYLSNIFQLLRKCILQMTKPVVEGPLGAPPFEKLSISKGITNFVIYKYGSLVQKVH